MLSSVPNLVEPVTKSVDDVIVCTISVCALIVLVTVKDPVIMALPLTSSLAFGVVLPIPTFPANVALAL